MKQSVFFIAMILLTASCNKPDAPDCFTRAGDVAQETRTLENFTRIDLHDLIELTIVEDTSATFAIVTANENLLDKIVTDVEANVLTIDNENTCRFVRSFKNKVSIELHTSDLSALINYGQGKIQSTNQLKTDVFFYEQNHGVGDVDLSLEADSVSVICHTGIGNIKLTGTTQKVGLFNGGYGVIDARYLQSEQAFVNNSSVNDIYVNFSEYLFASISLDGNIYYSGPSANVEPIIQGSGELIPLD
ncbi:GIN domain-containing protein [Halocola ammonii]